MSGTTERRICAVGMIKLLTESPEFLKTYHDLWWVHSPPLLVLHIAPTQGCALAMSGGPWCLTFAPGQLENLSFFIEEVVCQAHWISEAQSIGLPSTIFVGQNVASSNSVSWSQKCSLVLCNNIVNLVVKSARFLRLEFLHHVDACSPHFCRFIFLKIKSIKNSNGQLWADNKHFCF